MPRPKRPWFRTYVEMFGDRKIRRLTPTQRWVFAAMMGAARESPVVGKLFVAEALPMTRTELAEYAAVKEREIGPAIALMIQLGMVHLEGDVMVVTNFQRRQYESDVSTPRTQKHRSNHADGNDVGTAKPRSEERPSNGGGNAPETETENRDRSTSVGRESESSVTREPRGPEFCPAHPGGTTERCGPCGARRQHVAAYDAETARLAALQTSAAARERARRIRQAIDDCTLCDDQGERNGGLCDHIERQPGALARARAALTQPQSETNRESA